MFKRFNTHPSLQAYDDFILEWEPEFVDEDEDDATGANTSGTTSANTTSVNADNSSLVASKKQQLHGFKSLVQPMRNIREKCCLVHNATSKSLVLSLLTEEQAESMAFFFMISSI